MSVETLQPSEPMIEFDFTELGPQPDQPAEPGAAVPFGAELMVRATMGEHPASNPGDPTASRLTFPQNTTGTTLAGKADTKPDIGTDRTD